MSGASIAAIERVPPILTGLQYYSIPPGYASGTILVISGDVVATWIPVPVPGVITTIWVAVTAVNVTPVAAENFIGLTDYLGNLLGTSVDQGAAWGATGTVSAAIGTIRVNPPGVYGLVLSNAATNPTFRSGGPPGSDNLGPYIGSAVNPIPYQRAASGAVILPASFNPVASNVQRNAILMGLS
jgi:hypothetical protein